MPLLLAILAIVIIVCIASGAFVLLGIIVLLVVALLVREKLQFYTRTNCDVCYQETGFRGNKRFKLIDGYMCENCAKKLSQNNSVSGAGPKAFSHLDLFTVQEKIAERQVMGDERWNAKIADEAKRRKARLEEIDAQQAAATTPKCPHCGCTSLSADKKGFGVGKAAVGAAIAGPIGLAAGAKDSNKVILTCLNCGFQWKAGQYKK